MKRLEVALHPNAINDLFEIGNHIYRQTGSVALSRSYTARIREACEKIGTVPLGGRERSELGSGVRGWVFERRAVILYRVTSAGVLVLRIAHRGRHLAALRLD
jgi:toxin ParE1/3/4